MHTVYKLIQILLYPEVWIGTCFAAAWVLSGSAHRVRLARNFIALGLIAFFVLSTRPASDAVLRPLERWYDPPPIDALPQHDAIVVLGGGYKINPRTQAPTVLHSRSLDRLNCGIELLRNHVAPVLLLSGGPEGLVTFRAGSDAEAMQDMALRLGVTPSAIEIESSSLTTKDQAVEIRKRFAAGSRILLVTSALHLPRAVERFRQEGVDVTPMPCDYVTDPGPWGVMDFVPSAARMADIRAAIHEYVGLVMLHVS